MSLMFTNLLQFVNEQERIQYSAPPYAVVAGQQGNRRLRTLFPLSFSLSQS